MRNCLVALHGLFSVFDRYENNSEYVLQLFNLAEKLWKQLGMIREGLARGVYPFEHAHGEMNLADYVLKEIPERNDLLRVVYAAEQALDRVPSLYARVVAQLTSIAERVEEIIQLPPLLDPQTKCLEDEPQNPNRNESSQGI